MLKRILFDFYLLNKHYPKTKAILFQLENWMGGNDLESEKSTNYSPTTHALISQMPEVELNIVTLTSRARDIHNPIEYSDFMLTVEDIECTMSKFMGILNDKQKRNKKHKVEPILEEFTEACREILFKGRSNVSYENKQPTKEELNKKWILTKVG